MEKSVQEQDRTISWDDLTNIQDLNLNYHVNLPVPEDDDPDLVDEFCDPLKPVKVTFEDVSAAEFRIRRGLINTPCEYSQLSDSFNMRLYMKKEFQQMTGSFKERGARNVLLTLSREQKSVGVIAASAGNHALALAYHGSQLNIPVIVVMPKTAPLMKINNCVRYKATVLIQGDDLEETVKIAKKIGKITGKRYINGYDDPKILAGQGTLGLQIMEQVQNCDAIILSVGGGGLIAGVAVAVKTLNPNVLVYGVESEKCPSFSTALKVGNPVKIEQHSSLADGLSVKLVGGNSFATAKNFVDKVITVNEEFIALAILRLIEEEKAVVEGAGAAGLAGIMAGLFPELENKTVVVVLTGGNIDTTVFGRCIERGLAFDGRLVRFLVIVSDRPGGIAELTNLLAQNGVSIKDIFHERAWLASDVFSVQVKCVCETRDSAHAAELKKVIESRYKKFSWGPRVY